MGKAGEKQKRKPKIKDKRQSERFKKTAREVGADQSSDAFDKIIDELGRPKSSDENHEQRNEARYRHVRFCPSRSQLVSG